MDCNGIKCQNRSDDVQVLMLRRHRKQRKMDEWMINGTGAIITTTSATLSPCFVVAKTMGRMTPAAGRDDHTEKLQSGIFIYKLST